MVNVSKTSNRLKKWINANVELRSVIGTLWIKSSKKDDLNFNVPIVLRNST